jgi:NAD(P)-dependent dehydrogenase (short-subunit alcohol dehydrogenase family)
MADKPIKPLSGNTSIADWLDHPTGGPIIRDLLAQAGQDPSALKPVRRLALKRLVPMSKGAFTAEMIEDLARKANEAAGLDPNAVAAEDADAADDSADAAAPEWVEKVTAGRFDGKTVIVTGAGSGIGRATASRIAREGGRVIAVDVSKERLAEFAAEHSAQNVSTLVGDITDDGDVKKIVATAGDRIDGLANVAGIMDDMTALHEVSDKVWDRVMNVNVTGTFKLTRAVIPAMLKARVGSVVNVASEAALRGSAAGLAYTASKHAVVGMTKSSAFMYAPHNIRVNAVAPGPTITNISTTFDSEIGAERVQSAMGNIPTPAGADQLAASITFLLSDDSTNVTGIVLASDGGWSAV